MLFIMLFHFLLVQFSFFFIFIFIIFYILKIVFIPQIFVNCKLISFHFVLKINNLLVVLRKLHSKSFIDTI